MDKARGAGASMDKAASSTQRKSPRKRPRDVLRPHRTNLHAPANRPVASSKTRVPIPQTSAASLPARRCPGPTLDVVGLGFKTASGSQHRTSGGRRLRRACAVSEIPPSSGIEDPPKNGASFRVENGVANTNVQVRRCLFRNGINGRASGRADVWAGARIKNYTCCGMQQTE